MHIVHLLTVGERVPSSVILGGGSAILCHPGGAVKDSIPAKDGTPC